VATVYSTSFIQAQGVLGSVSFVVPAQFRAIVRDIDVYSGASAFSRTVNAVGGAGQTFWQHQYQPTDQDSQQFRGRVVLNQGETLTITVSGDVCDITVSGYLLTIP
jgi:hypothetical protein